MKVLVKNLKGTADHLPPSGYSSWEEYWTRKTGRRFSNCACLNCNFRAEVGGHVKKVNGGAEWYITPLCSSCNHYTNDEPFYVDSADLVPAR
ncbi:hypothetical protein SAMN04487831_106129 [Pseudobutyrivibrio sp. UC1225]|uniref:hypothetical protein n=1 Tax=Pseudobutyrivibrio sp. UC1225 TaxID=1798185 RepID=UPI0008F1103E|nr:hypothetical protein [Pseudobutyrivibrio sp. UC1225]SFO03641.1 hypothetical protein SAMN04487831_106129 [Pseudobutyrivibrio sp. UC1225]